ncbi:NADPH:quinone reductase [Haloprofundus sp. MHR1]|uniref:NADPH:quinone reductase n=1 Tax=Haloprofundus sp. MHR1 TaxID=2572921 RepID=UPI0010BF60FE|nr:NADPH:quinone reductase [Haloprofundus sp. MHR1]QCJ46419.1 NADPH:quinone reductase [Haloprofundus sp. MHR1]
MRAARFHEHGGPEVLTVDDVDSPEPGYGDVIVDVRAIGVNPVDTYFREGAYPVPSLPFTPGSDLAGVVSAVGDGVDRFAPGDRVFGTGLGNGMHGTYAEEVAAPAEFLATLPEGASFEDGAALALVGMTAWQALVAHAELEPAELALVHGGNGGVGHVAIQLAETMGARVLTTANPDYRDRLEALGAETVFDYGRSDLTESVQRVGAPEVVVDTRMDEYMQFDADVAAQGARVVCLGNSTEQAGLSAVGAAKSKDVRFQFMTMYNTPDKAAVLARLGDLLARGEVVPEIEQTYSLDEAGEAQRAVLEESFLGKLVITT